MLQYRLDNRFVDLLYTSRPDILLKEDSTFDVSKSVGH